MPYGHLKKFIIGLLFKMYITCSGWLNLIVASQALQERNRFDPTMIKGTLYRFILIFPYAIILRTVYSTDT